MQQTVKGTFGPKTTAAVKQFQKDRNLKNQTGVVDAETVAALGLGGTPLPSLSTKGVPLDPYADDREMFGPMTEAESKAKSVAAANEAAKKAQEAADAAKAAAQAAPQAAPQAAAAQVAADEAKSAAARTSLAPTAAIAKQEAAGAATAAITTAVATTQAAVQATTVSPAAAEAAAIAAGAARDAGEKVQKKNFFTREYGGVPVWGIGLIGTGGLTLLGLLAKLLFFSKTESQ